MKSFVLLLFCPILLISCIRSEFSDVGKNYESEYAYKKDSEIYRNSTTGRKLRGNIVLEDQGYFDSTVVFKTYTSFQKGIKEGEQKIYRNDTLIRINNFLNGKKHGEQIRYWRTSVTQSNFQNDIIDGEETEWENGKIIRKSNYCMGIKNGMEFLYDSLGNLENTIEYKLDSSEWTLPTQSMKNTFVQDHNDSLVNVLDFMNTHRAAYKGEITVNPEHNTWGWPEYVVHTSALNNPRNHQSMFYFYIVSFWGNDGLDQIWNDQWIVYTTVFNSEFEFVELKRP